LSFSLYNNFLLPPRM